MEKDKLKNFINENKEEFDIIEPSGELWGRIEGEISDDKPLFQLKPFLRIAATVVMILGASWIGFFLGTNQDEFSSKKKPAIENLHEYAFEGMSDELMEVERYYVSEVSIRESKLENSNVDEELLNEVKLLKEEFEELKKEMGQSIDPMKVIEAMIENYQLRLEILQDILDEIEKEEERQLIKEGNNENIA